MSTSPASQVHVVTGAGPVGSTIALQLAEAPDTRSDCSPDQEADPEHPLIERRKADVSQAGVLTEHFEGAVAVYHCIHGSAYSAKVWRSELPAAEQAVLIAAGAAGAVVVFPESLYSYGPVDVPMTEDLPRDGHKRQAGGSRGPPPGTRGILDRRQSALPPRTSTARSCGRHMRASASFLRCFPASGCRWSAASTSRTRSPTSPTSPGR